MTAVSVGPSCTKRRSRLHDSVVSILRHVVSILRPWVARLRAEAYDRDSRKPQPRMETMKRNGVTTPSNAASGRHSGKGATTVTAADQRADREHFKKSQAVSAATTRSFLANFRKKGA